VIVSSLDANIIVEIFAVQFCKYILGNTYSNNNNNNN